MSDSVCFACDGGREVLAGLCPVCGSPNLEFQRHLQAEFDYRFEERIAILVGGDPYADATTEQTALAMFEAIQAVDEISKANAEAHGLGKLHLN